MKYLFLVIALVAAVVLAALYVPVKDGKPLLDPDQVKALASDPASALGGSISQAPAGEPELYRWRDKRGNWQYGDVPPPGVAAEPVEVKPTKRLSPEAIRQGKLEDSQNTQ